MSRYFLAVDIGASSGRHILGHLDNGKLKIEEIYRFENGMVNKGGRLLWDVERLFEEIKNGMKECVKLGKIPE
ncbi:MAG: rhamnulokinase, partial [Lachnospiraceae bacterium]|nr:rhamnulokinase [Lachnospiraceae bacterium]